MNLNFRLKHLLAMILPDRFALRYLARLPQFYTWQKTHIDQSTPKFVRREDLYHYLYEKFVGGRPINYFEMGVWYGAAIKSWNKLDDNADSKYYGFDTFSGLPEVWEGLTANAEPGTFNVGGSIENVKIDDRRVTLVEGLFQETLPGFFDSVELNATHTNILHIDSDLYSSALYCRKRPFQAVIFI